MDTISSILYNILTILFPLRRFVYFSQQKTTAGTLIRHEIILKSKGKY